MFVFNYPIILLLGQLIASFQFEPKKPYFPGCGKGSWLCFVNRRCVSTETTGMKLVKEGDDVDAIGSFDSNCLWSVRIRRVNSGKDLVIMKLRSSHAEEISLKVFRNSAWEDKFGCKFDGSGKDALPITTDTMELVKSTIELVKSSQVYTCSGYLKEGIKIRNGNQLKVKANGEYVGEDVNFDMKDYQSCDQFQINANWINDYEGFLKADKVDPPRDDKIKCEKPKGLFYQRFIDFPSHPVTTITCSPSSHQYEIEMKNASDYPTSPNSPFLLFCGENVNTKCKEPTSIQCDDCTAANFTSGTGIKPSAIECPGNSFVLTVEGKERRIAGDPVCEGSAANWKEAVWSIQSIEGETLVFTGAACHPHLICFGKQRLHSECKEDKCSEAEVTQSDVNCPIGMNVTYEMDNSWIDTKGENVTCDTKENKWVPVLGRTSNVGCEFASGRKKETAENAFSPQKIIVIGLSLFIVLLIVATIAIGYFIWIRAKRKHRYSNGDLYELYDSARMSDSRRTEKQLDGLALRMHLHPGVDIELLRRKDESADLLFDDLLSARADYLNTQIMEEFDFYSIYERVKFTERLLEDLGTRTIPLRMIQLYRAILNKEEEYAVYDNLITAIKIIALSLRSQHKFKLSLRFNNLLFQFGRCFIQYYPHLPADDEDYRLMEMRTLALYTLGLTDCKDTFEFFNVIYVTMPGCIPPSIRKIIWATMIRLDNKFDDVKRIYENEITSPSNVDSDTRWGTKKEHLIYALCACQDRNKCEPVLNSVIREPHFTGNDILSGFTAMVKDYHENQDAAKFLFTERHKEIKEKLPVASDEYKKLFKMFYQFAFVSPSPLNKDWLMKFVGLEDTYEPEERKAMEFELAQAQMYGDLYKLVPKRYHDPKKGIDLKKQLKVLEEKYPYEIPKEKQK